MITTLQNTFLIYLKNTNIEFKRYMHYSFDMSEKLIGIIVLMCKKKIYGIFQLQMNRQLLQ